jgi:CheY-like chemotaxis protein
MSKTLLIVEDDGDIQNYYDFLFGDLDLELKRAFSGEEALTVLDREKDIDLILLDVVLPGMGGEEFYRILRNDLHMTVPVVVCSVDERISQRVQEVAEIQGIFTKGTDGNDLRDIVKNVLQIQD